MTTPARLEPGRLREIGPVVWGFSRLAGRVTGTEPPALFTTFGKNRRLFWGWLHFAGTLMPGGRLPRRETELIILRVATLAGSDYEFSHHARLGAKAGIHDDELERVRVGPQSDGWSDREQLLLAATDELYSERDLSEQTWSRLRSLLDERTSLEFLLLVGHYQMLATTLNTLRLRPDAPR